MSSETVVVPAFEKGGPNDPTKVFEDLNANLILCKEEFSPWGWRVYISDFEDRFEAEKRLRAMNALPHSGAEPKDGVLKGTPVWQERLDKMMLVEHLKFKVMRAHSRMVNGIELLLTSHAWLVKNPLLADTFAQLITHIPPSQFDRVDILQNQLRDTKKSLREAREYHEDYLITKLRQKQAYLLKTTMHQRVSNKLWALDDIMISWKELVMREQVRREQKARECLRARCIALQIEVVSVQENLQEKEREFTEALAWMTEDRDKFKKLYKRMVEAHERAKKDLEATKGTAEGMRQMIVVLSSEKTMLEHKVEDLEELRDKLLRQIAELRALVAALRAEIKRICGNIRESELALLDERNEVKRLIARNFDLEARLDEAASTEVALRDDIDCLQTELAAVFVKYDNVMYEADEERELRNAIEDERDKASEAARRFRAQLANTMKRCQEQVEAIKEKARRDLEYFKLVELQRVRDDYKRKTDVILRRNAILEKEVAEGDELTQCGVSVLNPLEMDSSKVCAVCKKCIVFEGVTKL